MAYILFRGGSIDYIPETDDILILHKPDYNIVKENEELPWHSSYDKYDGMRLKITGERKDPGNTTHGSYWIGIFENGDRASFVRFDINWFEKVNEYEELDEMHVDFFDI